MSAGRSRRRGLRLANLASRLRGCTSTAMSTAVSTEQMTMPPWYMKPEKPSMKAIMQMMPGQREHADDVE